MNTKSSNFSFYFIAPVIVILSFSLPILNTNAEEKIRFEQGECPAFASICTAIDLKKCITKIKAETQHKWLGSQVSREFMKRNPKIDIVKLKELKCVNSNENNPLGMIVVAYGTISDPNSLIKQNMDFNELAEHELFGIFQFNKSLDKYLNTVAILTTQRWQNYFVRSRSITENKIQLSGSGITYGDSAKIYELNLSWESPNTESTK